MKIKKKIRKYETIIYLKMNKSFYKTYYNICFKFIKINLNNLNHNA
jgi:hypothetical protein